MSRKPTLLPEEIKESIEKASGNIAAVARKHGVSRQAVYNLIRKNKGVQDVLEDARETMVDNVESKLYSQALEGNTTAMIFFLKTQGRKRGYVERVEHSGVSEDGKPSPIMIEIIAPTIQTEEVKHKEIRHKVVQPSEEE